jgi:Amt family ammonium transporter
MIAVAVLFVWGFGVSYIFFRILDKVWGLRVSPEDELEGLDIPEMGVLAYPDSQLVRSELDYDSSDNADIRQLARFNYNKAISRPYPSAPVPKKASVDQAVPVQILTEPAPASGGRVKMTKVEIICKQSKFEALKAAMNEIEVTGMTVTQVLGFGIQKGSTEYYRGAPMEVNLLPKVQVDIVVAKVPVRKVVETARQVLYTGNIGDGKIFVYDVENVIRVRTGEEGYDALQDED